MSEQKCNSNHVTNSFFTWAVGICVTVAIFIFGFLWAEMRSVRASFDSEAQNKGQRVATLEANDITRKEGIERLEEKVDTMNANLNNFIVEVRPLLLRNPNRQ